MKVLIIGGGIAGISVAEQLRKRGVDFHMLHQRMRPSSTEVSAGMYNPVVFRRLNLSWMVDELLPEMHAFYDDLSSFLGIELDTPMTIRKKIPNEDYRTMWTKRMTDPSHSKYLGPIVDGYGEVIGSGLIDCLLLQRSYLDHLETRESLLDENLNVADLVLTPDGVIYKQHTFSHAVFCEGPLAMENPYFNWLPFNICRGEWAVIETGEELTPVIVNNRINIIPLGRGRYRLASTYEWDRLDWQAGNTVPEDLLSGFTDLYPVPFKVVEQRAGLRPTVADRRPYLGRHPDQHRFSIFNGLGSKGMMLAPYFSKHLANHLLDNKPLLPEVDIERHIKRYHNRQSQD